MKTGKKTGTRVANLIRLAWGQSGLPERIFSVIIILMTAPRVWSLINTTVDLIRGGISLFSPRGSAYLFGLFKYPLYLAIVGFIACAVILFARVEGTIAKKKIMLVHCLKSEAIPFALISFGFEIISILLAWIMYVSDIAVLFLLAVGLLVLYAYVSVRLYISALDKIEDATDKSYDALLQKNLGQFIDTAIEMYDLAPCTKVILNGVAWYDLKKAAKERPRAWFTYKHDNVEAWQERSEAKRLFVSNDERLQSIEHILEKVFPNSATGSKLVRFVSEAVDVNAPILKNYAVNKRAFPHLRFEALNTFIARRQEEMEQLLRYRLNMYLKDYRDIKAGLDGEQALQNTLDMHNDALTPLHNIRLEFNNGKDSVEMDSIVITQSGVFACEAKNYGRDGTFRITIEADGAWYAEYPPKKGGGAPTRKIMKNPYAQNDRHVAFMEKLVNETLGRTRDNRVPVYNIIVLANDKVDLVCSPAAKQTLGRVGTVYNQIMQHNEKVLTLEEIDKLKDVFEQHNCPPKKYVLMDFGEEMSRLVVSYTRLHTYATQANAAIEECFKAHPSKDLPN